MRIESPEAERGKRIMYVELRNVNKYYGDFKASDNVSLGFDKGSLGALLGPSGSGKTTILRMIAGLETPDSGDILINGERVNETAPSDRGIGFVFQNYALFRYMTVYDNVAFGLKVKKTPKDKIDKRVKELLELTGLDKFSKRYPNQLSGGQRQRVAFARALAPEPELLLLDEPFAAVDAKVRQELRIWLRDMIYRLGITGIFVTHDQSEAVEVADQIVVTNKGRIEQSGTPMEIYGDPDTPFVANFIGQTLPIDNFYKLKGYESEEGEYSSAVIRPEFVEAFRTDSVVYKDLLPYSDEGTVESIVFRGDHLELLINVKGISIPVTRSLERRPVTVGEKMNVIVYRLYVFTDEEAILIKNRNLQDYAFKD